MKETIFLILGLAFVTIGVISIYDARYLSKKNFGFGDQNEGSDGLKVWGYIIAIIGGLILYFNW